MFLIQTFEPPPPPPPCTFSYGVPPGMEYRHQYNEIVKHFGEGSLKEAGAIRKDLQLRNVNIASYYTDKYVLWLDF